MIRKILICVATITVSLFCLNGTSNAGDEIMCYFDDNCPSDYFCKKISFGRMNIGVCMEEGVFDPEPQPRSGPGPESPILGAANEMFLETPISFKDDVLKIAVNKALGQPYYNVVTIGECLQLEKLEYPGNVLPNEWKIKDLYGLQYCKNLKRISLPYHNIIDISPLEGLTNLRYLNFRHNQIENISAVHNLTQLWVLSLTNNNIQFIAWETLHQLPIKRLYLRDNPLMHLLFLASLQNEKLEYFSASEPISGADQALEIIFNKLSPNVWGLALEGFDMSGMMSIVSSFEKLAFLYLEDSNIDDISELEKLKSLCHLSLPHNSIKDLMPLMYLDLLSTLNVSWNQIQTIEPLVTKVKGGHFQNGVAIFIQSNPLPVNLNSFQEHVDVIESYGINVGY